MPATPLRSASYARISKDRPDIPKVSNQLDDCRTKVAVTNDYTVPVEYAEEPGTSASKGTPRPGLDELIRDVMAGRYDVVLAVEQSRFNRSVIDNSMLMAACIATNTVIHTVREGKIDPRNASDEFMSTIFAARDRHEARRISERVKAANDHLIAKKKPIVTRRPFGFEPDGVTQRKREADALRWAITHVLAGGSTYEVMKQFRADSITPVISRKELAAAKEEGREPVVPKWSYGTLDGILLRPGNYGLLLHRGEVVGPGVWDGIGTAEEYERMKALLRDPTRSIAPSREPKHLMSGLLICGTCGGYMFATTQANRHHKGERLAVYRCIAQNKRASGSGPHACIMQHIVNGLVRASVATRFLLTDSGSDLHDDNGHGEVAAVQAQLAEVRAAKEDLVSMAGTPGFKAMFNKRSAELNAREHELQVTLNAIAGQAASRGLAGVLKADFWARVNLKQPAGYDGSADMDDTLNEVVTAFDALPLDQRKAIVKSMMIVSVGRGQGPLRVNITPINEHAPLKFTALR